MRLFLVLLLVLGVALVGCKKEETPAVDTSGAEGKMEELKEEAGKAATEVEKSVEETKEGATDALKDVTD